MHLRNRFPNYTYFPQNKKDLYYEVTKNITYHKLTEFGKKFYAK